MKESSMDPLRLLLVDDEPHILSALARQLRYHFRNDPRGIVVETANSPAAALTMMEERAYAVVVSDYRMPEITGVEVLSRMRSAQPHCTRIMLSGQVDQEGLTRAINSAHVHRFLAKPWTESALMEAVDEALEQHRVACQDQELLEAAKVEAGHMSPQEAERLRLERLEPGLTQVEFDSDGAYVLKA